MASIVDIGQIITTLNAQSSITTLLTGGIYWWPPVKEPTWPYLTIDLVTQTHSDFRRVARLQFNFLAHSETVSKKTLVTAFEAVNSYLTSTCRWIMQYGTFEALKTTQANWTRTFTSDVWWKKRNILIQDYCISFEKNV